MFGYTEPDHLIEGQLQAVRAGRDVCIQLRVPSPDYRERTERYRSELRRALGARVGERSDGCDPYAAYISLTGTPQTPVDQLLLYATDALAREDWVRLQADPDVPDAQLHYVERIEGHATGHGRNGSVTLY